MKTASRFSVMEKEPQEEPRSGDCAAVQKGRRVWSCSRDAAEPPGAPGTTEQAVGSKSGKNRSWSKRQFSSFVASNPDFNLDVPEVPAIRVPPPPSAAMRTVETPVQEWRVVMEELGEELCQRLEHLMENTLERVLEAALERNLSTSGLKSLLRSIDSPTELFGKPGKQIDIPEVLACKSDRSEQKVMFFTDQADPPDVDAASQASSPSPDCKKSKSDKSADDEPADAEDTKTHLKRLRFDEEVVPLASLEYEDHPHPSRHHPHHAGVWPSWAASKHARAAEPQLPIDDKVAQRNLKSSRLKVDIRVSFKEIEARGLDMKGNLQDLDTRIKRMAKMPSTVTDTYDFPVLQRLVMHPASNPILVWHIIGPVLLSYDIITIPMQAFPLPDLVFFAVVSVLSTAYWSLDTVRGFFTGFETDKSVEMRPGMIARRYLRTWFVLDAMTCTVDWTFLIMGNVGSFNKFWRTGRAMHAWRLLRLVRLFRVLKFARRLSACAADRITSLQGLITLKSIYIGFGVTFACHYMACYWYLVGSLDIPPITETNWLKANSMTNATLLEVYVSCFHWAMGQSGFTPAEIYPTNTFERLYASYVSFCWLIIVSVTINLFSMWLGHLHEHNKDREYQNIHLRRFLDEHDVSKKLTSRVLRSFRANYVTHQRRVHEEDVDFLRDLPVSLKICLRREVFVPILRKHPFFTFISRVNPILPIMITYCAMREDRHLAGDVIFAENTPAKSMLYVLTGCLNYYNVQGAMGVTKLNPGDWALEPALWLRWTCLGRLVTEITSELVSIDVEKFMAIMNHVQVKGEDTYYVKLFAKRICEHFLELHKSRFGAPTDLWQDPEEVREIGDEILAAAPPLAKPPTSEAEDSNGSWSLGQT